MGYATAATRECEGVQEVLANEAGGAEENKPQSDEGFLSLATVWPYWALLGSRAEFSK